MPCCFSIFFLSILNKQDTNKALFRLQANQIFKTDCLHCLQVIRSDLCVQTSPTCCICLGCCDGQQLRTLVAWLYNAEAWKMEIHHLALRAIPLPSKQFISVSVHGLLFPMLRHTALLVAAWVLLSHSKRHPGFHIKFCIASDRHRRHFCISNHLQLWFLQKMAFRVLLSRISKNQPGYSLDMPINGFRLAVWAKL